jgi:transaldolase
MNPLERLWEDHGQAVWLDYIERDLLTSGGLARLVAEDGLRGVTSNPSIFKAAITGGDAYDEIITDLLGRRPQTTTGELYEELVVEDIRMAADVLRPVFDDSGGGDGFVSLEVSPHLARDTAGTVAEAKRLWQRVARPNLMIKVPATAEGLPAVEALLGSGVNVNVTLMFSLAHYESVAHAYLRGLERTADPSRVASVASFFVSRVDTAVDGELEAVGGDALALRGLAAAANARLAYRRFLEIFDGDAFVALARRGAKVQRPLWASTSTKNPAYSDVKYVEELIASRTVNTLPPATMDAFRDHGQPRDGLEEGMATANDVLAKLEARGIDVGAITERLQGEGVAAFASAFDDLLTALERSRAERSAAPPVEA